MCGISGVYQPGQQQLALKPILTEMGSRLSHRGPDDQGIWVDSRNQIGFCHRRLSIVDLSSHGHQPMHSASQRYCIAYNGEIYNHVSLRVQLDKAGYSFKGHSDTEVLLAAIECWGLKNTLQKISGMFAFALWDKQEEKLCLVRDRMGEKPLYYGWLKGAFVFASELSALKSHPNWNAQIRRQSISDLLRYNYIPAPQSIYDGIYKLLPGHSVDIHPDQRCEPKPWWSLLECDSSPLKGDVSDSVELLDQTMQQVISEMQVADVPLGAFLSGGVDSSTVVSVMQAVSGSPVKTFTIGYDNADYDESAQARAIAKHLGTEHHEWIVTAKDALAVIPNLPNIYSEPFADASQVPTCLVSQLAKQHVTVALSGDGGDELFGGYNRHLWAPKFDHKMQLIPLLLRRLAASSLQLFSPRQWDSAFAILRQKTRQPGEKLHKIARILTAGNQQQLYELLVSAWQAPVPVIGQAQWQDDGLYQPVWGQDLSYAEKMMLLDSLTYLPDDILVKVDRAAMSYGLETRVPMLDHRLVALSRQIPMSHKVCIGQGKWVLKQVMQRYLPSSLCQQPKSGFGIPIHEWLRGELREWAESLLSTSRLSEQGYFDADVITKLWKVHLSGQANKQYQLWSVLMFQAWLESEEGGT